jgi:2,4-dienoyl-CoA reductase-like NADH-dependent reductase (Old Yellow Enzyme family)
LPGQPGYVAAQAVPDPQVLVDRFVQGARNAKAAGFDGVEIHAANGYLILKNRLRFALAVFDGTSKVFEPGNIGIKLNPTGGLNDVEMPLEATLETYGALIKTLVSKKVGYIQLVRFFEFFDQVIEGEKRATKMDVWETFAPLTSGSSTRVFLNGNISPEEAERLIASGIGDAVVIGRPMINNADYYKRTQNGRPLGSLDSMDPGTWYRSHTEPVPKYGNLPDPHIGLTDYPFAAEDCMTELRLPAGTGPAKN